MSKLHIHSICSPFNEPGLASAAMEALSRADAMGLLPQSTCLDDTACKGFKQVWPKPNRL